MIGTTNKFFVEIGVDTGKECNTRYLRTKENWHGVMFDTNDTGNPLIMIEHVDAENVVSLFKKYDIPHDFDLLSIDIDSNDYWVWKAITYNPRVVVIEYNGYQTVNENKIAKYDPKLAQSGNDYKGASLLAYYKLGIEKNYTLVGCNQFGVNAFFVRNDLIKNHFTMLEYEKLYRPFIGISLTSKKLVYYKKSDKEWIIGK